MATSDNNAPLLLDVSRLVWRRWAGLKPTGIDRICHAWMEHFGPRAQAVVIHRYGQAILPVHSSQALFGILAEPERRRGEVPRFRAALASLAIRRGGHLRDRLPGKGRFWLNPGHTGLDKPGVAAWCRHRHLRPVHLVHDLIPITHPQFCRQGEDERHRRRMRTALETAHGIIANSAHTLDVLREFARDEARDLPAAIVAWPGTPRLPIAPRPSAVEPTFVILGTIEGRKNHALLLALWRQMIEAGNMPVPRLVIVGRRGWQADTVFEQLDSNMFGDRVQEAGPLDDAAIARLLAGAKALLFPSLAEGFGFPLIEALACKVPVIASDLPVFREIGQGIADLLPPGDQQAWRDAIGDYCSPDSQRRSRQIARI
ncbi:MAG: glycosyltransferase family 1 protein, partial [Myxococcota bacterium]